MTVSTDEYDLIQRVFKTDQYNNLEKMARGDGWLKKVGFSGAWFVYDYETYKVVKGRNK